MQKEQEKKKKHKLIRCHIFVKHLDYMHDIHQKHRRNEWFSMLVLNFPNVTFAWDAIYQNYLKLLLLCSLAEIQSALTNADYYAPSLILSKWVWRKFALLHDGMASEIPLLVPSPCNCSNCVGAPSHGRFGAWTVLRPRLAPSRINSIRRQSSLRT